MTIFAIVKRHLLILAVLLLPVLATAQIRFDYNVTVDTRFDNRECDKGGNIYTNSATIFGVRLTPEIGFSATSGSEDGGYGVHGLASHRLMAGIDIAKDFGSKEGVGDLFKELVLYYRLDKQISSKSNFRLAAGIFPRTFSQGDYSEVFYSDSLKFYDPNFEGLLFSFRQPKSYFELGCDWLGQIGHGNRERFMLFSAGHGDPLPWFRLGYSAYMFHYANSYEVRGVVDNAIVNPYLRFDVGSYVHMQELSARLGYIVAYQWDRMKVPQPTIPMGGEFVVEARKWNVCLRNNLYYGQDLMPLYNDKDAGGFKYGNNLYYGDPYYRVRPNGEAGTKPAMYDHLEAFWEPRIAPGLYFRLGTNFYFNAGFSGWSQVIAVRFELDELRKSLLSR